MSNLIQGPFAGNTRRFDFATARNACRKFRRYNLVAAYAMLEATGAAGAVTITIDTLQRNTGFGRRNLLAAVRELLADGIITRETSPGGRPETRYLWSLDRISELSAEADVEPATSGTKPNSRDMFSRLRGVWEGSYLDARQADKRYRVRGAPFVGRPVDNTRTAKKPLSGWDRIELFSEAEMAALSLSLESIADGACRLYLALKAGSGGTDLVKAGHPMSFLPYELEGLRRPLEQLLRPSAPKASSPPPPAQHRETKEERAAAAARAREACAVAS